MAIFKTGIKFIHAPAIGKNHRASLVNFFSHLQLILFLDENDNIEGVKSFRFSAKHAELARSNLNAHPITTRTKAVVAHFSKYKNITYSRRASTEQDLRISIHSRKIRDGNNV